MRNYKQLSGHGFSLIELIIVVAIIGLIVALGLPQFGLFGRNNQSNTALETLKAEAQRAKSWAMAVRRGTQLPVSDGYDHRLVAYGLHIGSGAYVIWEVWNTESDPDDWQEYADVDELRKVSLSWDERIELKSIEPAGVTDIFFLTPDGAIEADFDGDNPIRVAIGIIDSDDSNRILCFATTGKIYECTP